MQASTNTIDLLYVADSADETDTVVDELATDGIRVSQVTTAEVSDRLTEESVDCLVLSDSVGADGPPAFVRRVRSGYPSVPIIAFTGDRGATFAEELLDAGVTELVRSTSDDASPSLVRRRLGTVLAAADRTGKEGVHTQLQQRQERDKLFRQVTESITDVVWVYSPDEEGVEFVNKAYETVWGRPREEVYENREAVIEGVHPEDRERVREAIARQLDNPEAYDEIYRVVQPDDEIRWVHSRAFGIREDGDLKHIVGVAQDITERRRHERHLAEERDLIEEQRDELVRLARTNRIIRGVDEALLDAGTREETLQAACEKLSESSRYQFAVALELVGADSLEPIVGSGLVAEFVDDVYPDGITAEGSPSNRAVESGETQVVQQGTSSPELQRWAEAIDHVDVRAMAAIPLSYEQQVHGVITVYSTQADAFSDRERRVLDELGGTVGHAIAAVESREREKTLTALYQATEDLLAAETETEVSEVVVDTAADVLDLSGIGIFLFDPDENVLRPAAATKTLLESYNDIREFRPGRDDSITWHTYVTGNEQFFTDVRESDRLVNPEMPARSLYAVPLSDHGVFVTLSTEVGAFDDQKRQLVGLLAATTEAALDRVAGQESIRERDQELEERRQRLERVEGSLSLVRDVNALLRGADTRDEIEEGVCEHLAGRERIAFAWIGRLLPDSDGFQPRAWAGAENGYLDAVSLALDGDEPVVRTAATGTTTTISNVTAHLREANWAREAVDRGYQSVLALPLTYGDTTYGVLAVYATEPDTFAGVVNDVFRELGETLAYGINSVETKYGILAEQVTELELRIDSPGTFLNAVAEVTAQELGYREITPQGDDRTRVLFGLSDQPPSEVLELESEFLAVESLTHVERNGEHLFRATLSGRTVATTLLECGGIPCQVAARGDETRVTVRVPRELDVRVFLDRVRDSYPDTELVSRHGVEHTTGAGGSVRDALEENLTERQREVLVTAYESGFFQSPRKTTGEELAELLDVSQPTVTHHLREAQRRLFTALLDEP